jgi:hypothetical protein
MRHGRLGTIDGADRLAILTLDACHDQTNTSPDTRKKTIGRVEGLG